MNERSKGIILKFFHTALASSAVGALFGVYDVFFHQENVKYLYDIKLLAFSFAGLFALAGGLYYIMAEECEYNPSELGFIVTVFASLLFVSEPYMGSYALMQNPPKGIIPFLIKLLLPISRILYLIVLLRNIASAIINGKRQTYIGLMIIAPLMGMSGLCLALFREGGSSVNTEMIFLWSSAMNTLMMLAILTFLLLQMTKIDLRYLVFWLCGILGLTIFCGLLHFAMLSEGVLKDSGTAFLPWIDRLPYIAMALFVLQTLRQTVRHTLRTKKRLSANVAATLWLLGGPIVTAILVPLPSSFVASSMLLVALITYALPILQGRPPYKQLINSIGFLVCIGGGLFTALDRSWGQGVLFAGILLVVLALVPPSPLRSHRA